MNRFIEIIKSGELFDSHSHFSDISISKEDILYDCKTNGVKYIVDVSTDSKSLIKVLESKKDYPEIILTSVGVHPEVLIPASSEESDIVPTLNYEEEIKALIKYFEENTPDLVGECGLDYFQLDRVGIQGVARESNIEKQKHLFKIHLDIAVQKQLPITIHSRASESDTLKILEEYIDKIPLIILHSFTGSLEDAIKAHSMGIYLGVNGIITYKSAENIREIVKTLFVNKPLNNPMDLYENKFLLETDAPLLMPRNIKTKHTENTPARIKNIWDFVYNLINEEKISKTNF